MNKILTDVLAGVETIAIGGHIRPDGDCAGSCMGLYNYIRENYPEKKVTVYLEELPNTLKFMKGTESIRQEVTQEDQADLFVMLDCGEEKRLGFSAPLYERAAHTFCVDHHVSNQALAENNHIFPDASSTCELVYGLMEPEKVSKETAECIYTGIVSDTGVFRYPCTSPDTMRVAAALMEKGIDQSAIITKTFDEKTYRQSQVLGYALLQSILFMDGRCIVSALTRKQMDFYQVLPKHLDGIVSQLKLTKGVDVAIFMYELEDGAYKVSLRSSDAVDVNKVAQYFGGGGHMRAAGFSMKGTIHDVINNVSDRIALQLPEGELE